MTAVPAVIVFDVNETLSDLSTLASRFAEIGAPEHLAPLWFSNVLRDGFALAAAGSQERFAVLGEHALRAVLAGRDLDRDLSQAVDHVMSGFTELDVHPDVPEGVRRLRATGARLVTLSNGASAVADGLLTRAGLREQFESLLSVEDAGRWKPAPEPYRYAASACGVGIGETMLVAVHAWDVDGAARAGARTAWITRDGAAYPPYVSRPEIRAGSLGQLAEALGA